jgi:hypothetical protein
MLRRVTWRIATDVSQAQKSSETTNSNFSWTAQPKQIGTTLPTNELPTGTAYHSFRLGSSPAQLERASNLG